MQHWKEREEWLQHFCEKHQSVKRQIFDPIFLNFPFLDNLWVTRFLRRKAWRDVAHLRQQLRDAIMAAAASPPLETEPERPPGLGNRLVAALREGSLTEKEFTDNLMVLFVASQENPQLLLTSTLRLLAQHPASQQRIHDELRSALTRHSGALAPALHDTPYLTAVVYEALRLYPPIAQLINRRAARSGVLVPAGSDPAAHADAPRALWVPAGTYLGYNAYSTNRDPVAWGPDADAFVPERWGGSAAAVRKAVSSRRARAEFVSFHGGRRACLGEQYTLLLARLTLAVLVARFEWVVDPGWDGAMTAVGTSLPALLLPCVDWRC